MTSLVVDRPEDAGIGRLLAVVAHHEQLAVRDHPADLVRETVVGSFTPSSFL